MTQIRKIFGGPGTGKTTRMIQVAQEEMDNRIPPNKISFLAYSRAAAEEAWKRLSEVQGYVGRERPEWFCTIHAACRRAIKWPSVKLWGWQHDEELNKITGRNIVINKQDAAMGNEPVDPSMGIIAFATAKKITIEAAMEFFPNATVTLPDVIEVHEAIRKMCKRHDIKTFDDLLLDYLKNPEPLNVRVMIIDEAQDLTPLQWEVVHHMWGNCERVYLCGDDDQTIYTFTGADAEGFLDHECDTEEVLPVSWRVPAKIGQYADRIISNVQHRKTKNIRWRDEPGELVSMSCDPCSVPIDEAETTMFLCRHQLICNQLYRQLLEEEVHVGMNEWSIYTSYGAEAVQVFFALRDGKTVKRNDAIKMLSHMQGKAQAEERLKATRGTDNYKTVQRKDFDIAWDQPVWRLFGRSRWEQENFYWMSRMISKKGEWIVGKTPPVRVLTMHASKGQEADHVILVPECFTSVVIDQIGQESDKEARLSYVAATRSKKRLTVLDPSTKNSMRFFQETPM